MKDAKGHGSNKRGEAASQHVVGLIQQAARHAMQFGSDKAAADELGRGNPKSGVAPVHSGASGRLPRGTVPEYAGRDAQGRTYTAALRDHDRFPKQNPTMPNSEDYRTKK